MKTMQLTHDLVALVDDTDWQALRVHNYQARKGAGSKHYASRSLRIGEKRTTITLQADIMRPSLTQRVLFRNGDTLDCQRTNLILADKIKPF